MVILPSFLFIPNFVLDIFNHHSTQLHFRWHLFGFIRSVYYHHWNTISFSSTMVSNVITSSPWKWNSTEGITCFCILTKEFQTACACYCYPWSYFNISCSDNSFPSLPCSLPNSISSNQWICKFIHSPNCTIKTIISSNSILRPSTWVTNRSASFNQSFTIFNCVDFVEFIIDIAELVSINACVSIA